MSIVKILQYPNNRLRQKAKLVQQFDDGLQRIVDDMFETHYAATNCAALAATQLDFDDPLHITVIDFSDNKDQPLCLINAQIIHHEGTRTESEGCMSVGGNTYEKVTRAAKIRVRAQDRHGETFEMDADGFMAKCIQHELDHLNGKLFIDHLSALKRARIDKKLRRN